MTRRPPRLGFTLIEMMVVMAIAGILLGLLMSAVQRVREQSNRSTCQNNLKQLAIAVHSYHAQKSRLPPYATGKPGEVYGGWFLHVMPYHNYGNIYEIVLANENTGGLGAPAIDMPEVADNVFSELLCPSDHTAHSPDDIGKTNYLANWYALSDGENGFYRPAVRFQDLTDGLASIVLFGEGYAVCDTLHRVALRSAVHHNFGITAQGKASDDPFYAPDDYTMFQIQPQSCDKWRAQTPHVAMHIALADASVRSVHGGISPATWTFALKPRDGETLGADWYD